MEEEEEGEEEEGGLKKLRGQNKHEKLAEQLLQFWSVIGQLKVRDSSTIQNRSLMHLFQFYITVIIIIIIIIIMDIK